MAATGSRRKDIWSPVGEQENSDEKEESLDLMAPKTLVNPFEHPLIMPPFPFPPAFPFGHFGFARMPLIMPPLNQALLAICSKSFQRLPFTHSSEPQKLSKPTCPPSTKAQTQTQNPIVNEILKDSVSEQHPINHNICAVCGEGFRLTGDLVHHMRRERCRWTLKSSSEAAPYHISKRGNKH